MGTELERRCVKQPLRQGQEPVSQRGTERERMVAMPTEKDPNIAIHLEAERRLAALKKLDPIRLFVKKQDVLVEAGEHDVPVRIFFPSDREQKEGVEEYRGGVLLFLHGGGWVTESVDTYERICSLMARSTGQLVLAVEYRRAPEHRFPVSLMDSYAAARALYAGEIMPHINPKDITLIGDSAGGNLTAAMVLLAREKKEFVPRRQILIYPALWNDYSDASPYPSVKENRENLILSQKKLVSYLELYARTPQDRQSPLFAPLLTKETLRDMPDTLILTAQRDPLRDEGEAYAVRLREAGNRVFLHRIEEAPHGFFALGLKHIFVEESLEYIRSFLRFEEEGEEKAVIAGE
ncbi:MAG: alpha/beta hydrolase [Eubacteriales bacterium]|nr:alpha/beta hydrolase [Eubacteriales bacterium]